MELPIDDNNLCLGVSPPKCSTVRVLEGTVATGEDDDLDDIAPELILAWAVRQWFAAWDIRDTVNGSEEGWLTGIKQTIQGWFRRGTSPGEKCRLHEHDMD